MLKSVVKTLGTGRAVHDKGIFWQVVGMTKKTISIISTLVIALIVSILLPAPAVAVPQPPHVFRGAVTVGGSAATDGLAVTAAIAGTTFSYALSAQTSAGRYGDDLRFKVPADDPDTSTKEGGVNGDTIVFYVQGVQAGTYTFTIGDVTQLSLSISALPVTPPAAPAAGAPPPPTTEELEAMTVAEAAEEVQEMSTSEAAAVLEEVTTEKAAAIIEVVTTSKAANIMEKITTEKAADIIEEVTTEKAAAIIEEMAIDKAAAIIEEVTTEKAADIIEEVTTEKAADIIEEITTEKAAAIIEEVATEKAAAIIEEVATEKAAAIIEEVATEKAAAILEEVATEKAAAIIEEVAADKAAAIIAEVATEKAAAILEKVATDKAAAVMEKLTTDNLTRVIPAMSETSLTERLPGLSADKLYSIEPAVLFASLPNAPTEQLVGEIPPEPPAELEAPVVVFTTPTGAKYLAIRTIAGEWVVVVGTPIPIDKLLIKTKRALSDVGTTLDVFEEQPAGVVVGLSAEQTVRAYINISFENIVLEDIRLGHMTFKVEKEWLEQNSVHKWSVALNRYDPRLRQWISLPTKRVKEDDIYVYYTVTITQFSTFAIAGSQVLPPVNFKATNLSLNPTEAKTGEGITISADITNLSEMAGTYVATLWINRTVEAGKDIFLEAGETKSISFTVTRTAEGSYEVRFDRLLDSFSVTKVVKPPIPPAPPLPAPAPPPAPPVAPPEVPPVTPISWWLIGGIIAAVIIIGVATWIVVVRRRGVEVEADKD